MSWIERQAQLTHLARLQLFFIGGAPRSGTTWLQQMLNAHPEVSCQGEALLQKHLAEPLANMMAERTKSLHAKNAGLFQHTGGYPLPTEQDTEHLLGTGILLALQQQSAEKNCRAVGEKTPENVFFFTRLKQLFPQAKFIAIARDPRDVLTSAWHFFKPKIVDENNENTKMEFIKTALPSLNEGASTMIALSQNFPDDYAMVTYEALKAFPIQSLGDLFKFLGVSSSESVVNDCLTRSSFALQTGGRSAGVAQNGAFLRNGIAGDWKSTLTPEMSKIVLEKLEWMFPHFGWKV